MDRKTKWRSFWLAALTALAILVLVPSVMGRDALPSWFSQIFNKRIQLGLDLQGGLHIVYSIDLDKAVDDKAVELKRDLEAQLEEKKIAGKVATPLRPLGAVRVALEDAASLAPIKSAVAADYDEIVEFLDCPGGGEAAAELCFRVSSDYADRIKKSALEQAIRTVRERINEKGVADPSVISKGDQILVELPGIDQVQIEEVKELIRRTAKLEFKIVDDGSDFMQKLYSHVFNDPKAKEEGISVDIDRWTHDETGKVFTDFYLSAADREKFLSNAEADELGCLSLGDEVDPRGRRCTVTGRQVIARYLSDLGEERPELKIDDEHQIGYELRGAIGPEDEPDWRTYYLLRPVELGGSAIQNSYVYWNPTTNRPEVLVEFNRWGGRRFGEMTGSNVGKKMAIILDDRVTSAPTIQARIDGGSSSITMGGSNPEEIQTEAQNLVNVLRTGSLPAPLRIDSESEVGPLLGADAVDKAKFSFALGSIFVVLIMVIYYRTAGVLSMVAVALNILFMMAVLAAFQATLTLPGIAALVLTVGMAVDANIIIYERIREELRTGKSVKGAVDAGFSRGFGAILDGQLTTAAAGWVLYQYGSGPIKGFAVMLLIGIISTLFTATWCTRLFFDIYLGKGRKSAISI